MLKKIELKDAVGTELAHDITEIRPGEFKGPAFHKGHTVCNEDICHLQRLGKNHLYAIDLAEVCRSVHECLVADLELGVYRTGHFRDIFVEKCAPRVPPQSGSPGPGNLDQPFLRALPGR